MSMSIKFFKRLISTQTYVNCIVSARKKEPQRKYFINIKRIKGFETLNVAK